MAIVNYYQDYGPARFRSNLTGRPLGRRALQKKITTHRLPVIESGNCCLIDEAAGDEALRRNARISHDAPRLPGRPRKARQAAE
jgi:hypothetical protein